VDRREGRGNWGRTGQLTRPKAGFLVLFLISHFRAMSSTSVNDRSSRSIKGCARDRKRQKETEGRQKERERERKRKKDAVISGQLVPRIDAGAHP